jgi:predicted nucleotidyltransferase
MEGTFVATSPLGRLVLAHREAVLAISARYHARNVRLLGSVVRGVETLESDVDFLVDFDENAHPLDILALGCDLEEELGVKVDVCTPRGLRSFVKEEIPHLFERFWRGDAGRRASGSGIGLSVVSGLVAAHGGRVEVYSQPDKGARFTVLIPLR